MHSELAENELSKCCGDEFCCSSLGPRRCCRLTFVPTTSETTLRGNRSSDLRRREGPFFGFLVDITFSPRTTSHTAPTTTADHVVLLVETSCSGTSAEVRSVHRSRSRRLQTSGQQARLLQKWRSSSPLSSSSSSRNSSSHFSCSP